MVLLEKRKERSSLGRRLCRWVDNIETDPLIREGGSEIDWSGSEWGQFVGLCEPCKEHFFPLKVLDFIFYYIRSRISQHSAQD